ncbi:hypothetical protein AVT69_gp336 [Pseudomonas phage PhiPA3]|uniref:Uncharacterized protein 338 n=1 Tax=Pseudomonas phage PhiPA3 TaxID=998086 RepID=F8SJH4_BPPA3|nr:hypothetical protein AVT69_gp336 [Pseudomonas phage PhiPA3]AEH03761.1 hypothetical protein [Pseudomonas phage PhiPA3]
MQQNHADAIRRLADEKPELYQHYLRIKFPLWMSYTPGGHNYSKGYTNIDRQLHLMAWAAETRELCKLAEELGIRIDGMPFHHQYDKSVELLMIRYSQAANLRKLRNSWKQVLEELGLNVPDSDWRRARQHHDEWAEEWKHFRKTINLAYGHLVINK